MDPELVEFFEEVNHKKWCIGFGHENVGYPLSCNVKQCLLLHADYLAFAKMQLLVKPVINSYVIYFRLLCNHAILYFVFYISHST